MHCNYTVFTIIHLENFCNNVVVHYNYDCNNVVITVQNVNFVLQHTVRIGNRMGLHAIKE